MSWAAIDPVSGFSYWVFRNEAFIEMSESDPYEGDIVIPEKINGLPVTGISNNAFDAAPITSVFIPASVKAIGENAFVNCEFLSKITFAENSQLEEVWDNAFAYTAIKSIIFPASLKVLVVAAMTGCEELETITFKSSSDIIQYELDIISSLTAIYVPKGTKEAYVAQFPDHADLIQEIDDTDGIKATTATETSASTAAIYTLEGKLVSKDGSTANLAKGIYIQNGKKVVISK